MTDKIQDEARKNRQLAADWAEEQDKNRKLSAELVVAQREFEKQKIDSENQEKYIARVATQLQKFRLGQYLKYKVLSKLTLGQLRAQYREKYQEQKLIYEDIKKGNFIYRKN